MTRSLTIVLGLLTVGCFQAPAIPADDSTDIRRDATHDTLVDATNDVLDKDLHDSDSGIDAAPDATLGDSEFSSERPQFCDTALLEHRFDSFEFTNGTVLQGVDTQANNASIFFGNSSAQFDRTGALLGEHSREWNVPDGGFVIRTSLKGTGGVIAKDRRSYSDADIRIRYSEDEAGIRTLSMRYQIGTDLEPGGDEFVYSGAIVSDHIYDLFVQWTDGVITFYVDGEPVDSGPAPDFTMNSNQLIFGGLNDTDDFVGPERYRAFLSGAVHYFALYDQPIDDEGISMLSRCDPDLDLGD